MNIYQRIVLILGAIALIIIIWTSPKVIYHGISMLNAEKYSNSDFTKNLARVIDIKTTSFRIIGVIGCTIFIFYAIKSKK